MARIEMLKARPTLCYRCWGRGHVKAQCRATVDRSRICYRCGVEGHPALGCQAPVSCAICKENDRDHAHRVGSANCTVTSVGLAGTSSGEKQVSRKTEESVRGAVSMDCDAE